MQVPQGVDRRAAEVEAACSKDTARPALMEPWLQGDHLYATDSYIAVRIPVADVSLDTGGVVPGTALKAARKRKGDAARIALMNGTAEVDTLDGRVSINRPEGYTFPSIDALIPETTEDATTIGINLTKLTQAGKALGADAVRLTILGPNKPILIEPQTRDGRIALVMPMRLTEPLR